MSHDGSTEALVIGGGIGGLTAALTLRPVGIQVKVIEKTPELREVGAGITLWTNAMRVLDRLGVAASIQEAGSLLARAEVRTWKGDVLSTTQMDEMGRKYGAPSVAIHRADLQKILFDALPAGTVRLGAGLRSFGQDEQGVSAQFSDGTEEWADLLVGADGIRTKVRTLIFGEEEPRYSGYTAWRGIASLGHSSISIGATSESWGQGARFGIVPIGHDRVYWFCTANVPQDERDGEGGRKADVLRRFQEWHAPIPELIEATAEGAILRNDIMDRKPFSPWGRGRVTLLGDAAHPMTPNLGQGACQAIEDAAVLAASVSAEPDVVSSLRAYEERRRKRTAGMVTQSWRIGKIAQLENPLLISLRNAVVRHSSRMSRRQLEAIISYEA